MATLGEKIKKLRKKSNISQEELADELKVSRQTMSSWETDKVRLVWDNIVALCKFFNVEPDYFMSEDAPFLTESDGGELSATSDSADEETASTLCEQSEEVKPKKKKNKKIFLTVLVIGLTVDVLALSFVAYLSASLDGASESVASFVWNSDDMSTLIKIITGILAFILLGIAVCFVVRYYKNKKRN